MSDEYGLSAYLDAAMRRARFEMIDNCQTVYGEIPVLSGVYATALVREACRRELRDVLTGWALLGLSMKHEIPSVDGINLSAR